MALNLRSLRHSSYLTAAVSALERRIAAVESSPASSGGASLLHGEGVPAPGTGSNDDFYLDTTNTRLYGPKASGAWGIGVLLVGTAGSDGVSFSYQGHWVSGTAYVSGDWVTYAGALYACNGNVVSTTAAPPVDAGWSLASSPSVPTAYSNAMLFAPGSTGTLTFTSIGLGASRIVPLMIPVDASISALAIEVTTGEANSVARLGLYADNGSVYPGALLSHGTVGCDSPGLKTVTLGTPVVSQGLMWLALKAEVGSTATVRGVSSPSSYVSVDVTVSASNSLACGYVCSSSQNDTSLRSTFPVRLGTGFGYASTGPRVGVVLA